MENTLDNFYLRQQEPVKSCLLALREIILSKSDDITNVLKYGMPFFCYKGKMFCYLWVHKRDQQPYLGIVEGKLIHHPDLMMEKRSRMKIIVFDSRKDLPIRIINMILKQTLELYTSGRIKTKS